MWQEAGTEHLAVVFAFRLNYSTGNYLKTISRVSITSVKSVRRVVRFKTVYDLFHVQPVHRSLLFNDCNARSGNAIHCVLRISIPHDYRMGTRSRGIVEGLIFNSRRYDLRVFFFFLLLTRSILLGFRRACSDNRTGRPTRERRI